MPLYNEYPSGRILMGKTVMFNRISLDGFFAGPNGEIEWFIHDPDVDIAVHQLMDPDTALFGRITYQMFDNYWPNVALNSDASEEERAIAEELAQMNKLVFTRTMKNVTWENSRLVDGDLVEEVKRINQGKAADNVIFGSGTIVQQLTDQGLIDEYLIVVTPVILGEGKPLFKRVQLRNLELIGTKTFDSGNVLLHYQL